MFESSGKENNEAVKLQDVHGGEAVNRRHKALSELTPDDWQNMSGVTSETDDSVPQLDLFNQESGSDKQSNLAEKLAGHVSREDFLSPDQELKDFSRLFEKNLERLDMDGNLQLDRAELASSFRMHGLDCKDAAFVCTAREFMKQTGHRIVSRFEVADFITSSTRAFLPAEVRRFGLQNFERLDQNHDSFIQSNELLSLMRSVDTDSRQRVVMTEMLRRLPQISASYTENANSNSRGVSEIDLELFPANSSYADQDIIQSTIQINSVMYDALTAGEGTCRKLFADETDPQKSIRPEAILQGRVGDCSFLAALGAVASIHPEAIVNMITPLGDDQYAVKFPGAKEPVLVEAPTTQELATFAHGNAYGMWPALLEKAFGMQLKKSQGDKACDEKILQEYNVGKGLKAFELLLGKKPLAVALDLVPEEFLHLGLSFITEHDIPFTVGTKFARGDSAVFDKAGLVDGHAYTVLKYDPESRTVTLRNPWGSFEPHSEGKAKDGKDDGVFKLSLKVLKQWFDIGCFAI